MSKGKQVVLIDDDEMILELLRYWFNKTGYDTKEFTTGHIASTYILENASFVDLIVLDRLLPDMDGITLLSRLPENIPLLFLSVLSKDHEMVHSRRDNFIDYIAKPFRVEHVLERAQILMAKGMP
ncbi:MAG: response regulator [Chlamydiae bacterium]|nr:response regulator [Chlamydiota bacterium]